MNQGGTADITVLESLTFKTVFLIIRGNYMYYPSLEMLEKLDLKSYDLVPIKKEDRKSTRLNSSHPSSSRMPSSA